MVDFGHSLRHVSAARPGSRTVRQRYIAFKGMVADTFNSLSDEEAEFLALVYDETRRFSKTINLADMLLKRDCIQNCVTDLTLFGENLARAKRTDLQLRVENYIINNAPPQNVPERLFSLQPPQVPQVSTRQLTADTTYPVQAVESRVTSTRVANSVQTSQPRVTSTTVAHSIQASQPGATSTRVAHPIQTSQPGAMSTRVIMNTIHPIQDLEAELAVSSVYPVQISAPRSMSSALREVSVEEECETDVSTSSTLVYHRTRGQKRRRVGENTLEEAAAIDVIMFQECDTTSNNSNDMDHGSQEASPEDKKFMQLAQNAAKNSKDDRTKVGAVIVDSKKEKVLGTGWNRMPRGCEGKFSWARAVPIEEGKFFYVVYAIRAAIFDAYQQKHDLVGTTLYTTLYPSNVCAQCIRDAGITEVVYSSDKFHDMNFMEASRRILEGIICRYTRNLSSYFVSEKLHRQYSDKD